MASAYSGVASAQTHCDNTVSAGESIQDAVAAAGAGDTICVEPGTYEEQLVIDKDVDVIGTDPNNRPVIDGTDKSGRGITLEGADGVVLENLVITRFTDGLYFDIGSGAVEDLRLEHVDTVDNYRYGIVGLSGGSGGPPHDHLTFVSVNASGNDGSFLGRGVFFKAAVDNVTVKDSTFRNNGLVGFDIGTSDADPNTSEHETVDIVNVETAGNGGVGVAVHAAKDVEVRESTIADGMDLNGVIDTEVTENEFENMDGFGVRMRSEYGAGSPKNVSVSFNNFNANSVGVNNAVDGFTLDAIENWWGHASGPCGLGGRRNPAGKEVGKGAEIKGDVDFDPWLKRPIDHPSR